MEVEAVKLFSRVLLDVSTGHMTAKDDELLKLADENPEFQYRINEEADGVLYVETKDQGHYVRVLGDPETFTPAYRAEIRGKLVDMGFSGSFLRVLDMVIDQRAAGESVISVGNDTVVLYCSGIEFDADGMIYDELAVHEW